MLGVTLCSVSNGKTEKCRTYLHEFHELHEISNSYYPCWGEKDGMHGVLMCVCEVNNINLCLYCSECSRQQALTGVCLPVRGRDRESKLRAWELNELSNQIWRSGEDFHQENCLFFPFPLTANASIVTHSSADATHPLFYHPNLTLMLQTCL